MYLRRVVPIFLALLFISVIPHAKAQQSPDWIPAGIEQLGRTAAFHTDFTFDRTMLQLASGLSGDLDEETKHVIAKLNGISVHSYRYAAPNLYDPHQLDVVRQQYHVAGWQHLVSTAKPQPGVDANGRTDLYLKFEHMDVTGMVLLVSTPRNLNVIALSGDLSPLDLLHLRGHFGIPKFSDDNFVLSPN